MEQISTEKKTNILFQYGLIAALGSVLLFVLLYLGGTTFFGSPIVIPISLAIPIVVAIFACIKAKRENGGFLLFKEALKICFGIFVFSIFATSLLSYLLYNFIDPAFKESMLQLTIEKTQQWMAKFGAPQDSIDKTIQEMAKMDLGSIGTIAKSFAQGCIFWFIIALIVAAIMKKKKPEFAEHQ
jgi:Protein of unknown function (DUF4199)